MTEGNGDVRELPKGWLITKLGKVCEVVRGGSPRPMGNPKYFNGNIPFIKIADITKVKGKTIFDAETKVNEEGSKKSRLLPKGSLILSNSGTVCIPKFLGAEACIHDGFVAFLGLPDEISKEYLFYYFQYLRPYVIQKHKQGITQVNLNIEIVSDFDLRLPPTNEQKRIIDKIEELSSDLDQGIESLKTAQKQLKVYRQAVLKWAFEGKLTEEWRKQHQSTLKTGEALLTQIKAERENRYQQQLAEWETAVKEWEAIEKVGKKPNKPQRRKELSIITSSELAELPKLPDDWCWVKLGEITEVSGGLTKNSKRNELNLKLPYLRVANVYANRFDLDEIFDIGLERGEVERVLLKQNDLLVVEGNGSIEQIGRVAIWGGKINPCVHQNHLIKARPSKSLNVKCALYFLLSYQGREFIKREAGSTSGLHTLSLSKVENLKIPLSSEEEQEEIVQEIESRLSICDQLEATITENLQKAEALRQSILKQAFEGKLVPQDPNDEPAEKLLEQIRLERQEKQPQPAKKQLKIKGT